MSTTTRRVPVTTGQPYSALDKFERVRTPLVLGEQHPVEFVVGVRAESPVTPEVVCQHVPFCSTVPVFNSIWADRIGRPERLYGSDREVASHPANPVKLGNDSLPVPNGWDGASLLHYFGTVSIDRETGRLVLSEPIAAEMLSLKNVTFDDSIFEYDGGVWGAATLYCQQGGERHPWLKSRLNDQQHFPQSRAALFELFQRRGRVLRRAQSTMIDLPQGSVHTRELGVPRRLCAASC